jgi:hypothetical protein
MTHTTKQRISGLILAASLLISATAGASVKRTDNEMLADCIDSVNAQYQNIDSVKAANITSRRNFFRARLRVVADGERSSMTCVIRGDQAIALTCKSGDSCPANVIAAN